MTTRIAHGTGVQTGGLLLATAATIVLDQMGVIDDTPNLIAIVSAALLIVGLPHGSFDLALLRRAGVVASQLTLISLYVACAGVMYLVWRIAPALALAGFLAMAVAHFAEDWQDCGSRFVGLGIAAAIVSAPSLLHGDSLRGLFVALTADPGAALLADMLLLVAPASIAIAAVGCWLLWQADRRSLAISVGCGLAAMVLLPPVVGFGLFFCLIHSPMQFRSHADALGLRQFRQWRGVVVPITLGGLGVAVVIFLLNGGASIAVGVFASSFMTLSALAVPHMLVPMIAGRGGIGSRSPWLSPGSAS